MISAVVISYLLGSIPTALIAGFLIGKTDIRTIGSKNAGATNLYRAYGLKPYILVLSLDIFKGFASTYWVSSLAGAEILETHQAMILCGSAAVFGHIFTIFAGFKGGKGVATAAGMMLALIPVPLLISLAVYFAVTSVTHYVSLGSISAAISLPLVCLGAGFFLGVTYPVEIYVIVIFLGILIVVTHRSNITRLLKGEENKTYFFKGR